MAERRQDNRRAADARRSKRNQRANIRLNVSKRVDFENDGRASFAFTRDISGRGAFLRSSQIIPIDTQLDLAFNLERDQEPVVIRANVIRAEEDGMETGFGVNFDPDGQQEALARIMQYVLSALEERASERVRINPRDIHSLFILADISKERVQLDQTEEYLRTITDIERPSAAHGYLAELQLQRAIESDDLALYQKARDLFEIALDLGPDNGFEDGLAQCQQRLDAIKRQESEAEERRQAQEQARQRALEQQQENNARRERELADLQEELEVARRRHEADQTSLAAREEEISAARQELENLRDSLEQQQGRIAEQSDALQSREDALNEQQMRYKEQVATQALQGERRAQEQAVLRNELQAAREQIEQVKAGLAEECNADRLEIDQEKQAVADQRNAFIEQAAELEKERKQLLEQQEKFAQTRQSVEQEHGQLDEQHASIKQHEQELEEQRRDLESSNLELDNKLEQLAVEQATLQDSLVDFERNQTELRARSEQLDQWAADLQRETQEHELQSEDFQLLKTQQIREKNRLTEQLRELEKSREELAEQLAAGEKRRTISTRSLRPSTKNKAISICRPPSLKRNKRPYTSGPKRLATSWLKNAKARQNSKPSSRSPKKIC